ncbi:hypothetical protein M758_2G015800 [Ceratodon purpureus]|nr:hypothetical protein M758_2G015800 [Ceratodon purpureus]
MAFNGALWSQLPLEVVEQILSFLPMPDLCRYCTTCKTWNELIKNPAFNVLHVCNRNKHLPFIAIHSITTSIQDEYIDGSQVLCFLDISSRKWYSMKPRDALQTSFLFDLRYFQIVAMEGGLVLLKCLKRTPKLYYHEIDCTQLCVWNPIKNIKIKLPCVPGHNHIHSSSLLNFLIDDIAETFKVFIIKLDWKSHGVDIYDSVIKEWKVSSKLDTNNMSMFQIIQTGVFQNLLYILCFEDAYELWRYNHVADIWERLHFAESFFVEPDYTYDIWHEEFIVSGKHLLLTYWCQLREFGEFDVFEVHEIDIQSRATKVLLTWTRTRIMTIFHIIDDDDRRYFPHIHVIGFNKSLMLVSNLSRNIVIFDIETKETNFEWPQLPLRKLKVEEEYSLMGKQMDFLLPGTLK